jgi:hypothetical protein
VLTDETEWAVAIQFAQVGCRPIVAGVNLQNLLINRQKFKSIDRSLMVCQHFWLKDFAEFKFNFGHNIGLKSKEKWKKRGRGARARAATPAVGQRW